MISKVLPTFKGFDTCMPQYMTNIREVHDYDIHHNLQDGFVEHIHIANIHPIDEDLSCLQVRARHLWKNNNYYIFYRRIKMHEYGSCLSYGLQANKYLSYTHYVNK